MNVSQFHLMSQQVSLILESKGININETDLTYDLLLESELNKLDSYILSIEVKSPDDVIQFLNFLKIYHNETPKSLNKYRVERGYYYGSRICLVIELK